MRILYYALGGGHGHVLRGLAVLRALGSGALIVPARLACWARALGVEPLVAPSERAGEVSAWLAALPAPSLLLVDVFPRGAAQELWPLLERAPAWLVSRRVRPEAYLAEKTREIIECRYERLLWCEPPPLPLRRLSIAQTEVSPVLLATERLERAAARRELRVARDDRLVLALGSGGRERQMRLHRLLEKIAGRLRVELRFVSAELPAGGTVLASFPAARLFRAADVIVTAAGYHAFHETRLAGVPTVFVPQERKLDDQRWRCKGLPVASGPRELEQLVSRALVAPTAPEQPYPDGARRVAALVERRVQQGVLDEEQVAAVAGRGVLPAPNGAADLGIARTVEDVGHRLPPDVSE